MLYLPVDIQDCTGETKLQDITGSYLFFLYTRLLMPWFDIKQIWAVFQEKNTINIIIEVSLFDASSYLK